MVVRGRHDDVGGPLDSSISLSYKYFVSLKYFILVTVKEYISFNNPQHFGISEMVCFI